MVFTTTKCLLRTQRLQADIADHRIKMMPFSPEFLKELSDQNGCEAKSGEVDLPSQQGQSKLHKVSSTTCMSSRSMENVPVPVIEGQNKVFHTVSISERCSLVGLLDDSGSLFVSGICKVTALKGSVTINGYALSTSGENALTAHIRCPIWQPAYPVVGSRTDSCARSIEFKTPVKSSNHNMHVVADFLAKYGISCASQTQQKGKGTGGGKGGNMTGLFDEFAVLFAIECCPAGEQEWMVAAEDQTAYGCAACSTANEKESYYDTVKVATTPALKFQEVSILGLESAMLGNYSAMTQHRADCMTLPVSWVSASSTVLNHYNSDNTAKAVLCGAKGVGKSTCLRYLVNRLLSASETAHNAARLSNRRISSAHILGTASNKADATCACAVDCVNEPVVCVIDCDLGQPELSVPGSVSLHVVSVKDHTGAHTGGILSAQHLNLQEPDTSYFLGDVTSKHEPKLVLEYVRLLLLRYQEIVSEVSAAQEKNRKTATKKFVQSNAFNALMLDGSDESDAESEEEAPNNANKRNTNSAKVPPIPLVVNLDGYVKNMGAEILESILAMLEPTHTLHICSDRDRNILPLEAILGLVMPGTEETNEGVAAGREAVPATAEKRQSANHSAAQLPSTLPPTTSTAAPKQQCSLLLLEPGRYYTTPRVAAVDLRSLRLVAYFLRHDAGLRGFARGGVATSTSTGNMTRTNSTEKLTSAENPLPSSASGLGEGISIRNGALIDPQGALALRLLAQPPYAVPFSHLSLATIPSCGDLPDRLMLAAMNASLVGILIFENSAASAAGGDELGDAGLDTHEMHVRNMRNFRHGGVDFQLCCLDQYPVSRCIGIGIIRAIDIPNQRIILCTPVDGALLTAPNTKLCLLKGNNLTLPSLMTYAPMFPAFPYMSSESSGEGSAQLRTRNNVKRRAQHQGD